MSRPFAVSPARSKYMWTTPAPVSMTGTRAFSRTKRMSPRPPRGMTTSTMPSACSSASAASRVEGRSVNEASSSPSARSVSRIIAAAASFVRAASAPPLTMEALAVLRQSAKTSSVTLGRASHITPTTPKGTRTLLIVIPFGRLQLSIVSPCGEPSAATCSMPAAISSMRRGVSRRRSYIGSSGDMAARSTALAAIRRLESLLRASAQRRSVRSKVSVSVAANEAAARRAARNMASYDVSDAVFILCRDNRNVLRV